MKIKTGILLFATLWLFLAISACKEEPELFGNEFTLTSQYPFFDGNTITFDAGKQTVIIDVNTDIPTGLWKYSYAVDEVWFTLMRKESNQLAITVEQNNTYFPRTAHVNVSLNGKVQHIDIRQREKYQLEFADGPTRLVRGGKSNIALPLLTNISPGNLSLTIEPKSDWINPVIIGNSEIAFTVEENDTGAPRVATFTLSCEGQTVSIIITQLVPNKPYVINLAGINFNNCYIYEIWDEVNNVKIGELCKELLYKKGPDGLDIVHKQAIVAYPMLGDKLDLSNGLVVEDGFFVAWNPNPSAADPTNILTYYKQGEQNVWLPASSWTAMDAKIYLDKSASRMTTIEPESGDRITTVLRPYIFRDQRSGPANGMSSTLTRTTDWGVQTYNGTSEDFYYRVVKVGTQYWMAENLRTSRYNDGTPIPTSISTSVVGLGIPLCLVTGFYNGAGSSTTNANSNTTAYIDIRNTFGVNYTYCAIVQQNCVSRTQPLMPPFEDHISPAGWKVPQKTQLEMLRNYASQSTLALVTVPELVALSPHDPAATYTHSYLNATGFSLFNGRYRSGSHSVGTPAILASMDYMMDISQALDYDTHRFYCLRMSQTAIFNIFNGNNYYACRAAVSIRCIRKE